MESRQTDIDEIRAVVQQIYAAISGPAGTRDWAANAHAFAPEGRSMVAHRQDDGTVKLQPLTVDDFRRTREPYFLTHAFYEQETSADVQVFGSLAHVLSHYESRHDLNQPPFETGVNSIQLAKTSAGWRVVSCMWQAGEIGRTMADQ